MWAGPRSADSGAKRLRHVLEVQAVDILPAETGQSLELGGGANLQVLSAGKRGAVFLLEWSDFSRYNVKGNTLIDRLLALMNWKEE